MNENTQYYPNNGRYVAPAGTIYAQYVCPVPNPCRKYHVSASLPSAEAVANLVLPYLSSRKILHKVVKNRSLLTAQGQGDQAGKFITIYMNGNVPQRNATIAELGTALADLKRREQVQPSPRVPRSRGYSHLFIEQPLDEEMFIYGGFVCDPSE
jgi:hypothetical protein